MIKYSLIIFKIFGKINQIKAYKKFKLENNIVSIKTYKIHYIYWKKNCLPRFSTENSISVIQEVPYLSNVSQTNSYSEITFFLDISRNKIKILIEVKMFRIHIYYNETTPSFKKCASGSRALLNGTVYH